MAKYGGLSLKLLLTRAFGQLEAELRASSNLPKGKMVIEMSHQDMEELGTTIPKVIKDAPVVEAMTTFTLTAATVDAGGKVADLLDAVRKYGVMEAGAKVWQAIEYTEDEIPVMTYLKVNMFPGGTPQS